MYIPAVKENSETDVILVNPFPEGARGINEATIEPPLGLISIAAVLEQHGFKCRIIEANVKQLSNPEVLKLISNLKPFLVGISMNIITNDAGIELSKMAKSSLRDVIVILGGPNPTVIPEKSIERSLADAVAVGESEKTVLEIAQKIKIGQHPFLNTAGVVFQDNGSIVRTSPRSRITDLDSLPIPAYHLLPDFKLYKTRARRRPVGAVITSRGCPYQCIFCYKGVFPGKTVMLSAEKVLEIIDHLVKFYRIRQLDILDDIFTISTQRTNAILDGLIRRDYKLVINLQSGIRVENIDRKTIQKMKKAGVFKIGIGVESGDPAILKIMKKELDLNKVLNVTKEFKRFGMTVYGFFILGLPGETPETMQKTIDFAKRMDPHVANFTIAMPLIGSPLYHLIQREGRFLVDVQGSIKDGFYSGKAFFEIGDLKEEQVRKYFGKAYRDFYFRPTKIFKMLMGIRSLSELRWIINAGLSLIPQK